MGLDTSILVLLEAGGYTPEWRSSFTDRAASAAACLLFNVASPRHGCKAVLTYYS